MFDNLPDHQNYRLKQWVWLFNVYVRSLRGGNIFTGVCPRGQGAMGIAILSRMEDWETVVGIAEWC